MGRMEEVGGEQNEWKKIRRGWCFGAESFVGEMKEKLLELGEKPRDREGWNDVASEELEEERAM